MIHAHALVELDELDPSTNVWAFAHVMAGARIGRNVNICDHAFIEGGATIGDNVTIKNSVCVWDGVCIEDDVFVGPRVTFTNDKAPRAARSEFGKARYAQPDRWLSRTQVRRGASLGAGAVILSDLEIGPFSMVAAGSVVTKCVPAFALVMGNPARHVGDVCSCGQRLAGLFNLANCHQCGETAARRNALLGELRSSL